MEVQDARYNTRLFLLLRLVMRYVVNNQEYESVTLLPERSAVWFCGNALPRVNLDLKN